MLVDWNGEAKHNTEGTARREEFVESSTAPLKRHEKITRPFTQEPVLHVGQEKEPIYNPVKLLRDPWE